MEPRECIVLAGGLGTRLSAVLPGIPKCMAPVAGQPFLKYVIRYLSSQGIERFVFSLGYRKEVIIEYLEGEFPWLNYQVVVEEEPLGTGGAIRLACGQVHGNHVFVVNGDTLFRADLPAIARQHEESGADLTLALKSMQGFDRYGSVETDDTGRVTGFFEKRFFDHGDINAGCYLLDVSSFQELDFPEKFSFEKDYLERYFEELNFSGCIQDAYFIDIGIPADFERAQHELEPVPLMLQSIDPSWALFLDRDGVINYEKENDYILNWDEFEFYPGVPEALASLAGKFSTIVVVSNQRGVGRGLMKESDLLDIQERMRTRISAAGGRIDGIYYCTATDAKSFCRKPNPGMALQARKDFPAIQPSKSIMVGNKMSDMQFGRNAATFTVYLRTTHPDQSFPHADIDAVFNDLADFAKAL